MKITLRPKVWTLFSVINLSCKYTEDTLAMPFVKWIKLHKKSYQHCQQIDKKWVWSFNWIPNWYNFHKFSIQHWPEAERIDGHAHVISKCGFTVIFVSIIIIIHTIKVFQRLYLDLSFVGSDGKLKEKHSRTQQLMLSNLWWISLWLSTYRDDHIQTNINIIDSSFQNFQDFQDRT